MPGRRPPPEPEEEANGHAGLKFNESLSWRAGKPIPVQTLLERLQALAAELRKFEQDEADPNWFTDIAQHLVAKNLLAHKDTGVKSLTACCLVDVLKLCAPDAPFSAQQLNDIFVMIIKDILPTLADPSHAYNTEHLYVLESLATFKSICLLADIPSFEALISHLFSNFFDILSGPRNNESTSQSLELNMTAILITMVDEAPNIPTEVVDMIVAQFLRLDPRAIGGHTGKSQRISAVADGKQSTLELKVFPAAYNVARNICNSVPDKMGAHVVQYFSDIIVDASESAQRSSKRRSSDEGFDGGVHHSEEDLRELQKAHLLLRELWRACPGVLQNLIPQLEAELSMENVQLRLLATETFADMISGIGCAGLPARTSIDPAAWPLVMLSDPPQTASQNPVTKPSSPQSFPSTYPSAYNSFLGRKNDKSPLIRCAWTKGVGNILRTSAGGTGLSTGEEERLVADLSRTLCDADEKVRLAAVKVASNFTFHDVINRLGSSGGMNKADSFLSTLADRARDRKHVVRVEAMRVLGSVWAAAVGELMAGNTEVSSKIGAIPSKLLGGYYANDPEINVSIDNVLFEQLLPLSYPPIKAKASKELHSKSRKMNGTQEPGSEDPDQLRAARILLLVSGLDEKARLVFFSSIQQRQTRLSQYADMYIQRCEDYNGGVTDKDDKALKDHLYRLIAEIAKQFPEPGNVTAHLWRLAKLHDRRCYKLMQFCMAPESDYRTVVRGIMEFKRRIESSVTGSKDMLETLLPLLYRISIIIYNKSHVPTILSISKTDAYGFGETAHRVLLEISTKNPSVLKAHVKELCKSLQESAPTSEKSIPSPATIVGDLKACSSFAMKFADEIPKDRKFKEAMQGFALYGSPPECAKHAVNILMISSDKKELTAHDLAQKCMKNLKNDKPGYLTRLATLSQLMLLAPTAITGLRKEILDIARRRILQESGTQNLKTASDTYVYTLPMDDDCSAKCWALKILANCVRSHDDPDTLDEAAESIYTLMHDLVVDNSALSDSNRNPGKHRPHLRLMAARLFLKCCTQKHQDHLLTPEHFNTLALVAQDEELPVRSRFLARLRKYLTQGRLPQRFYAIPFLLAFEPNELLRTETTTWLRSRSAYFSSGNFRSSNEKASGKSAIVLESVFARLLSLLAHHPDFRNEPDDLVDFSRYIAFYLSTVANSDNLSLIYHIAQRVKQSRDALAPSSTDDTLYILSDLAQLTIRRFEDLQGFTINTLPTRIKLPGSLFKDIQEHADAQAIADKNFLPEGDDDVEDQVERVVREFLRKTSDKRGNKKRKSEGDAGGGASKRSRTGNALPIRPSASKAASKKVGGTAVGKKTVAKTPKSSKKKKTTGDGDGDAPSSENRRRSGRVGLVGKSYAEDEEDEEEVDDDEVLSWRYESKDGEIVVDTAAADDSDIESSSAERESNGSSEPLEADVQGNGDNPSLRNGKHHKHDDDDDSHADDDDNMQIDDDHGDDDDAAAEDQLQSEASASAGRGGAGGGGGGENAFDLPPSTSPPAGRGKQRGSAWKRASAGGKGKAKGKRVAKSTIPSPPSPPPPSKTSKTSLKGRGPAKSDDADAAAAAAAGATSKSTANTRARRRR